MSDLEQSDIENMSGYEDSINEQEESSSPTFTINSKSNAITSTVPNEDGQSGDENEEVQDEVQEVQDEDDDDASIMNSDDEDDEEEGEEEEEEDENDDDISLDEETGIINKKTKPIVKKSSKIVNEISPTKLDIPVEFEKNESDYESNDDEEEDDDYLQKFDKGIRDNYILEQHPESINHNYDEIYNLAKVQRNKENIIIDDLHKTIPILTKYEKTRILGQRAKQLNNGAKPLVKMDIPLIDGYLIALKELEEKMIPVIIRRPLPSGASEYWHLKDLEIL